MNHRRIKFRVWFEKEKRWIHGPHEMASLDGINLFGESILFGNFLDGVSIVDLNEVFAFQYTGLKDKNGKEIFEGDIISWELEVCSERGEFQDYVSSGKGEVYYENGSFQVKGLRDFPLNHGSWKVKKYEVIGNICDNPELK